MPKRTMFTNITPLPPQVSREVAIAMLHNHDEMIELNPLVIEHHSIKTPRDAPADEFLDCVWQELTDKIHYLPGGLMKGKVTYRACFHDTPVGLQTHIYAPMGLDIREKWTIGGNLPGEPPEARELGLDTPKQGLYIREDCDMKCNMMLTGFVRKNLDNSHQVLVDRIIKKAERVEEHLKTISPTTSGTNVTTTGTGIQPGSHMSRSQFITSPLSSPRQENFPSPYPTSPHSQVPDSTLVHPAFRNELPGSSHSESGHTPPAYHTLNGQQTGYIQDMKHNPYERQQQIQYSPPQHAQSVNRVPQGPVVSNGRAFLSELPGSLPRPAAQKKPWQDPTQYQDSVSESSSTRPSRQDYATYLTPSGSSNQRESVVSDQSQTSSYRHQGYSPPGSRKVSEAGSDKMVDDSALPSKPTFKQYKAQLSGQF